MKNTLVLFSLIFVCVHVSSAQRLGHSTFTPYGGSTEFNNHLIYHNSGEVLVDRHDISEVRLFDGLLYNLSHAQFPFSYIHVKFFYDKDQNGLRSNDEPLLRHGSFTIEGQETFTSNSDQGILLSVHSGNYTILYTELGSNDWTLTNEEEYNFVIGDNINSIDIEYGLYREPESEIDIKMVSDPFRCFSPVNYRICVMNHGTTPETGTVWLQMDARFEDIWYEQEPDHMIDSTFVGWDMTIQPGGLNVYKYGIIAPEITDASELGTLYFTLVRVETDFGITTEELTQEFLCSYDPNDKLVSPNRTDSLALLDQALTYTIRFQNTGNSYAENIVVTDTISEYLNMNSFRLIDTSHPDELTVVINEDDDHIVNFQFDNIFLPDSIENNEGSNGFIMYQIAPNTDTDINTEINNTAHIYFDYNPAIVTNTTSTTLVDTFPVIVATQELEIQEDILVYPNPTKGMILLDKRVDVVKTYDIYGRRVGTYFDTDKLSLSKLGAGTFILELNLRETQIMKKVIIID